MVTQASSNRPGLPNSESRVSALKISPLFDQIRPSSFTYQQQLDLPGLIGLVQSQGFVPQSGQEKQQLLTDLQKLYEQGSDSSGVCVVYRIEVYLSEPTALPEQYGRLKAP